MAVDVTLTDDGLSVSLTGMDAVWAVSGGLSLPLSEVVGARVVGADEAKGRLRWKTAGSGVPGVVKAGRFTVQDEPGVRELWSTYRDTEYLEITTTRDRPRRIVLQHPGRVALAAAITTKARGA
jgi:hypothetical protein